MTQGTPGTSPQSFRASLRLESQCDFDSIRQSTRLIRSFLSERGLQDLELDAWELALAEAGNNAVEHVMPENRNIPIGLDVSCDERDVEVRVTDHTPGFDWPDEVELPDPTDEGGRGLFLIRSLTDEAVYLRARDQNCLVLRKQRSGEVSLAQPTVETLQTRLAEAETALTEMTDELASCYESLTTIFRYSAGFGSSQEILSFSKNLLADLAQVTQADAVVLRIANTGQSQLPATTTAPERFQGMVAPASLLSDTPSFERDAAMNRQDSWFDPDTQLSDQDPLKPLGMALGICHPCVSNDQLVGTITLCRNAPDHPFAAAQLSLLHTFSDFLAIQIVNTRLIEERLRTGVTRRELEIASEIQRTLLPANVPDRPHLTVAASCLSAREVGGDIYDVIPIDSSCLFVLVADVMGKGVPAALFASVLRSTMRSMAHLHRQPGRLLTAVNQLLHDDFSRVDMFATAQAAYVDPSRGTLLVASAGHCPLLLWTPGNATAEAAGDAGLPLGIEQNAVYEATEVPFPPEACALLYTDGLTEARNPQAEFLGQDRLAQWLAETASKSDSARAMQSRLLNQLGVFRSGSRNTDDETAVLVRHLP
ncbi:MAG: SpoIIE family protein phosphatase [Verrucomicrobia bacterium]|nr:SpoIIE family protein phosphatase [Verrucomicrobiota bacterium]